MDRLKLIKDFRYKNRRCIVIKMELIKPSLMDGMGGLSNSKLPKNFFVAYHNGYVELKDDELKNDCGDYDIDSDEITYYGDLTNFQALHNLKDLPDGKFYVGFDSAHSWNHEHPESKTAEYVVNTCKKIVEELNNKKKE